MNGFAAAQLNTAPGEGDGDRVRLAAFIADDVTRACVAAALGDGWPDASITIGGVDQAIEHLTRNDSIRYLIVDVSGLDVPLSALDRLADVCPPGTALIVIGEINDVHLYRALRMAGAVDYLVKPVTPESLRTALDALRHDGATVETVQPKAATGQVIAIIGARGGVGTTTVATTLAWLSAEDEGRRTMLLDLDLHYGAVSLALDVEPGHGLREALESPDRIDSLFVAASSAVLRDKLHLLCSEAPLEAPTMICVGAIGRLLVELRRDFERIVIDLPRSNLDLLREGLMEADIIVIVTDFSLTGLRDTQRLSFFAQQAAPAARVLMIANRVGVAKKGEVLRADAEKIIGMPLAAIVPEDSMAVPYAINGGKALPVGAPRSRATEALRSFMRGLSGPQAGKSIGLLQRLLASLKPAA
jgi:pilus assembly protein CpaE